ncbi:MAG TPA: FtsX-like permease family protein, partial [Blastocatellia bacterium]|nr:FtsX-like permease family protein [Blastocatellia bacterium]
SVIRIPGHPPANAQQPPYANYSFASAGYFSAVGTPILEGRDFSATDTLESTHVTIINKAMAKKFWPGEDPIGRQVGVNTVKWPVRTIIGIVGDIKHSSLREDPTPEMFVPYTQNEIKVWPSMQSLQVAVRTKADPVSIVAGLRKAVHSVDPDLPIARVTLLTDLVSSSMTQTRFSMFLLLTFGVLSLLLALIGLYGVISYSVQQRTQQIGIRIALGASRGNVLTLILGQGARLAGIGIIVGLVSAFGVTRTMSAFLYGVEATDPLTFIFVAFLLMAAALFACYLPARRAMRVDPLVALRYE